ncbi:MAG: hypothetical protein ACI97A_004124 [Planctomycetota bacterium]|jgi:hypothetical protein
MKPILALFCISWLLLLMSSNVYAQRTSNVLASGHQLTCAKVVGKNADVVLIQDGQTLFCMSQKKDGPAISNIVVLPKKSYVWDFVDSAPGVDGLGEIIVQTAEGVQGAVVKSTESSPQFVKLSEAGDLFRGNLSAPAVGKKFAWRVGTRTYWVIPTLTGLQTFERDAEGKITDFGVKPARLTSTQALSSSMGYRLKARVTVPFFDLDTDAEGQQNLLFRQDSYYSSRPFSSGELGTWGKAPSTEDNLVVEFEHRIAPLCLDFDGDGRKDLLHVDPGSGTTLIYESRKRELGKGAEPNRVFRITGHILWRWLIDADGDGKKDLFLLELSKLSKIAQVKVMQNRSLPVVLSMRRQLSGGRFQASANWSDHFELPCEISLTRNVKRVRFRAPVQLIKTLNQEVQLLAPAEEGKVATYRRAENSWEVMSTHPHLYVEDGFLAEPFDAQIWQSGESRGHLILLARNPKAAKDRVLMLPLAKGK